MRLICAVIGLALFAADANAFCGGRLAARRNYGCEGYNNGYNQGCNGYNQGYYSQGCSGYNAGCYGRAAGCQGYQAYAVAYRGCQGGSGTTGFYGPMGGGYYQGGSGVYVVPYQADHPHIHAAPLPTPQKAINKE